MALMALSQIPILELLRLFLPQLKPPRPPALRPLPHGLPFLFARSLRLAQSQQVVSCLLQDLQDAVGRETGNRKPQTS